MKSVTLEISDADFAKFSLTNDVIAFNDLKEKIALQFAKEAFQKCNQEADNTDLQLLTADDIDSEINEVRNAKNSR